MDNADVTIPSPIYVPQTTPGAGTYSSTNPYGSTSSTINPSINIYEQQRAYRLKLAGERREYIARKLKEGLPVKFLIFHIIVVLIFIATAVAMQTISIVTKLSIWYICQGYV